MIRHGDDPVIFAPDLSVPGTLWGDRKTEIEKPIRKLRGDSSLTRTGRRIWVFAGLLGAALAAFAANAGRFLVVDDPQQSDVILVLAGETNTRPARALELLRQGYGTRLVIDVPSASRTYQFTDLQLAEKYVESLPEASAVTICPVEGLSTREESHDAARCLEHEAGSRVLIVTSDFHARRSLSIFRHEVRGKVFSVAAAHDDTQFGTRWWTHRQWAKTCFDEWLRLLWWSALERWH